MTGVGLTDALLGIIVPPNMFTGTIDRAILETLAYSDIFEYPLRLDELHRYLAVRVNKDELSDRLQLLAGWVGEKDGFHFLEGRDEIVHIRKQREEVSRSLMPHALRYGRILGSLPFVRMAALTGSLAVMNVSQNADFDYMLVTAPGRVWTARAFALLFNRFTRLLGHALCPNLVISETSLVWHQRDLYTARELCQMIPVAGFDVYQRLMQANGWVKDFLPNIGQTSEVSEPSEVLLQSVFELPWRGRFGDSFERWEMSRKIARLSKQSGFGDETVFTAEICQGNFDHHRKWTQKMFEERLASFEKDVAVTFLLQSQSPAASRGDALRRTQP